MKGKAVSGLLLMLLLIGVLPFVFNIQPIKATETIIYIKPDGSIEPAMANISSADNVTYIFTDNNYANIVVEKNNIVIDGACYTLQGEGVVWGERGTGINMSDRSNVTIKNMNIKNFDYAVYLSSSSLCSVSGNNISIRGEVRLYYSSNNTISDNYLTDSSGSPAINLYESSNHNTVSGNNITRNAGGIGIYTSSDYNTISGNNITKNTFSGIDIGSSSNHNTVSGNYFTGNSWGIGITDSSYNTISGNNMPSNVGFYGSRGIAFGSSSYNVVTGNNITDTGAPSGSHDGAIWTTDSSFNTFSANNLIENGIGVWTELSLNNSFYHNNLINNTIQVVSDDQSINIWDHGYPSGGNYWSNYTGVDVKSGPYQNETGSDGIGDTEHVVDVNNTDFYPLMSPYPSIHAISVEGVQLKTSLAQGFSTKLYFRVSNGHFTETFNVTAYANSTLVDNLTNVTVPSGNSTTITVTCNATSLSKGLYNVSVCTTPVPEELYTEDNVWTYWVLVTIMGDVDCDRDVDVGDQRKVQLAMFSVPGDPNWNPNMDIDGDLDVDVGDQRKQQLHMFESW